MALAVCSMHFTGMYALHVHTDTAFRPVTGAPPLTLLVPIFMFVLLVAIGWAYAMLNSPSAEDVAELGQLRQRISRTADAVPSRVPRGSGFRLPTTTSDRPVPRLVAPVVAPGTLARLAPPTLAAGDLVVRPWTRSDAPAVVDAYADPAIQRWHTRSMTPAEAADWIASWPRRWRRRTVPAGRSPAARRSSGR